MKTKIYFYLVAILTVTTCVSCSKDNEDNSLVFSVQYSGGGTAVDENLTINSDTTSFSSSYYDLTTMKRKSYQTTIKTSKELWDSLTQTFDLGTFVKIENGSCRACVDGIDETFSVIKNGTTYSFYNGVKNEHYQQMQNFLDLILEQIKTLQDNADYK